MTTKFVLTTADGARATMNVREWLNVRFVRFVIAGCIAFVVDASILTILVEFVGWPPTWARVVSFPSAVTVNWLMHRAHVFEPTDKPHTEYLKFASVQALSASINLGIYFTAVISSPLMARWPIVPLIIGSVAAMFLTYFCNSRFVFAQSSRRTTTEP